MRHMLLCMLADVQEYRRDKTTLMSQYVSDRLEKSFNQYDSQLQKSLEFLTRKHEKSLIKRMNFK